MTFDYPKISFLGSFCGLEKFFLKHSEDRRIKAFRRNYTFHVVDISYQKGYTAAQPISVQMVFYETRALNVFD